MSDCNEIVRTTESMFFLFDEIDTVLPFKFPASYSSGE